MHIQSFPGASRMVMGHTIQGQGINAACEGRALRVDTGMSRGCGNGEVEVLEVRNDGQQASCVCVFVCVCVGICVFVYVLVRKAPIS
jgi:hypothetical protein